MTKRIGGFVEKFFYTIIAYIHGNISPKKILCRCAHIPWNLIVSIGREYTADPVDTSLNKLCSSLSKNGKSTTQSNQGCWLVGENERSRKKGLVHFRHSRLCDARDKPAAKVGLFNK